MGAKLKHFKTVWKHKIVVYQECKACGITWQGIIHDLSKFSPIEFSASAKHFQGNNCPMEAEDSDYSLAWLHHKGTNKHHWEWWIDFDKDGRVVANKIPSRYVVEMICDWIGAGKVYNKEKWTQSEPLNYFNKVRKGRYFHPETEKLIVYLLEIIRDYGLERFHRICRQRYYVFTDYDGLFIP